MTNKFRFLLTIAVACTMLTSCDTPNNKPMDKETEAVTEALATTQSSTTTTEAQNTSVETTTKATASTTAEQQTTEATTQTTTHTTTETIQETIQETTEQTELQNETNEGYSNKKVSWSYKRNENHEPPIGYNEKVDLQKYGAYYIGDTSEKVIYLTFDEGYENGYTPKILDTLKDNDVKAAFFVTGSYIKNSLDLVKRMIEEGHIVANHTDTHPILTDITDQQIMQEIKNIENALYESTGYKMDKFLRPPQGDFSERVLAVLQSEGYKTIFWSFAHNDWQVDNQPPVQQTIDLVMSNYHNGMLPLLHAVSESNTEALDSIIKQLKQLGYEFKTLYDLP